MIFYTSIVFFCSFLYGLSAVLCKYGLQHNVHLRSYKLKSLLVFLAHNKIWLFGVLLSFATNIAIVELQSFIDVSVVYPILNFSYVFVVILGYLFLNEVLTLPQWFGVITVIIGTALLIFIDLPATGVETRVPSLLAISVVSLLTIGVTVFLVYQRNIENYELFYAVCTGIALGNVQIFMKANTNFVTLELGHFSVFSLQSVLHFITLWPIFMLAIFSLAGWVFMQIAYSHGNVSITVPVFAVIQSVLTLISGYLVFGEYFGFQKIIGCITITLGVLILILSTVDEKEISTV